MSGPVWWLLEKSYQKPQYYLLQFCNVFLEFWNILKYLRELLVKNSWWDTLVSANFLSSDRKTNLWKLSYFRRMFVSSSLCLLAPLFLDKCHQIKEIYPSLWFFEYTCLYVYIRYRTLDFMYCQNSYMQRSLWSYAEVGTKSAWFLLQAFGETEGKLKKQMP